jgi:hypothetical protein
MSLQLLNEICGVNGHHDNKVRVVHSEQPRRVSSDCALGKREGSTVFSITYQEENRVHNRGNQKRAGESGKYDIVAMKFRAPTDMNLISINDQRYPISPSAASAVSCSEKTVTPAPQLPVCLRGSATTTRKTRHRGAQSCRSNGDSESQRAQSGFGCPLRVPELARARPSPRGAPSGWCWCRGEIACVTKHILFRCSLRRWSSPLRKQCKGMQSASTSTHAVREQGTALPSSSGRMGGVVSGGLSSIPWGARWTPPRSQVPSNAIKRAHPTRLGRPLGP